MVCEIPLSRGLVALIDDEDFDLVGQFKWCATPGNRTFYAMRSAYIDGVQRNVRMHRVITECAKGMDVDHIDGDGLNNRRSNLRVVTRTLNNANSRIRKDSSTGYRGVEHGNGATPRWRAAIQIQGKVITRPYRVSPEEAARDYDELARSFYGDVSRLNFPGPGERSAR